jgi:uncharacterized Zn-finger protein
MRSDVDTRLNQFFYLLESRDAGDGFQALWKELYSSDNNESSRVPLLDTTTNLVIGDQTTSATRVVDFVSNCAQEQEIVICYACHNIFTSAEFAVHETTGCDKKATEITSCQPKYTCSVCEKEFKKLFNLKQHVRTHTGERPLQCSYCDKCFSDRSSMNKHQRTVHEDRRPHTCDVCHKGFASTSHLNDHMAIHSKERNFVCQLCRRTFSFRTSLKKHLATHSVEKPFKCKICLKNFKTKVSVKAHMKKIHRIPFNRFTCDV